MPIHRYEDVDYTAPVSPQVQEKAQADTDRMLMVNPDGAFALLNHEIDRLHFRRKMFGLAELEEEIVARTAELEVRFG